LGGPGEARQCWCKGTSGIHRGTADLSPWTCRSTSADRSHLYLGYACRSSEFLGKLWQCEARDALAYDKERSELIKHYLTKIFLCRFSLTFVSQTYRDVATRLRSSPSIVQPSRTHMTSLIAGQTHAPSSANSMSLRPGGMVRLMVRKRLAMETDEREGSLSVLQSI
jgi:hypothetical protein